MRQWFAILLLALSAHSFANDGASPAQLAITGDPAGAAAVVRGQPLTFTVKRYVSSAAKDDAYVRLDDGLRALARDRGVQVGDGSAGALTVEVDSTFYVYTNRFNARLVRLPEYTQAQLDRTADVEVTRAEQKPDMVRIAAGALGIVRGWISPSFGSYMIAGGTTPALFGAGKAPTRLFVAGKERYERGEQEVNTKVRVLRNGVAVGAFSIRNWTTGDEPPFLIDGLVADNWSGMLDILRGSAVCSSDDDCDRAMMSPAGPLACCPLVD